MEAEPKMRGQELVPAAILLIAGVILLGLIINAGWLAAADLPDAGLEPLYLRRPDAEVPTRTKSTLGAPRLALRRTR